ncbi:MAG: tetratricopeptide repeat protein, partial [Phycisphaerales bacterium JB058]
MQRAARLAAHFIGALLCFSAFGQEEVSTPQFTLTLPEWDSDPEDLPPELRPWSIERPTLPEDAAAVVAELEARITGIQDAWPEAETREAQDAFLNEAIGLAERVLALREEYQGNGEKILRWRNAAGEPTAWFEVTDARARLDQLKALLGASPKERRQFREAMAFITARTRSATGQSPAEVAEQLRDALEVTKSMLGGGHPGVVLANARTGYVLQAIGHLAGAEQNYRSAVNAALQSLGSDHPDFLFSASSFGYFLTVTGRPAEGEVYYKQALLGYRRIYGDSHTRTIAAINNVGYALHEQGRFDEVALFARAALIGFEATQGSDHVDTLTAANNLGYLLERLGILADGVGYLLFANRGFRRLTHEHPLMSSVLGNMGYLRDKQGRAHEAEEYWLLAIETSRNESGRIDPSAQQWVNNLGTLKASQGRDVKAESYYRSAIADFRSSMDPRHPYILRSKANLGALLAKRGDLGQARPYLVDALDGFREQLGDDHPFTLSAIHMLG